MKKVFCYVVLLMMGVMILVGCAEANNTKVNLSSNTSAEAKQKQTQRPSGWDTVRIEGVVEFQIPPTMELSEKALQKAANVETIDSMTKVYNFANTKEELIIAALPKSVNTRETTGKEFVVVRFELSEYQDKGSLPKWGEDLYYPKQFLLELEKADISKEQKLPWVEKVDVLQHPEIIKINDTSCLNMKNRSRLKGGDWYTRDIYMFFNGDRGYTFTIFLGASEYEYWTAKDNDLREIVKTLRLCR